MRRTFAAVRMRRGRGAAAIAHCIAASLAALLTASGAVIAAEPATPAGDAPPAAAKASPAASPAPPTRKAAPSADAFRGPRETWERLGRAIARHDRNAALAELTPAARERYAAELDRMLAERRFDAAHFGRVQSVTLSGADFATVTVARRKEDGTYGAQVLLMRGADGRWRIDQM